MNSSDAIDDAYESTHFPDEETTLGNDCYEVAAVSDPLERESHETNQDHGVAHLLMQTYNVL